MSFIKKGHDNSKYVDGVFAISNLAKSDQNPNKINATAGCLLDDDGKIVAYKTVYNSLNAIPNTSKAAYAESPLGNVAYNEAILDYVLAGKVKGKAIATAGGTGALSLAINMCLNEGDTILLPEVAWGNYVLMAKENNLKVINYDIYDFEGLLNKLKDLDRIFLLINSPCQNPTGQSYSYEQWSRLIAELNELNKETIILNDVAYLDYAFDEHKKDYFELFNKLNNNTLVLIAYSCSKTFSYYGCRLGSLICIHKDEEFLKEFENQCAKHNRTIWSNVNNGLMINIADVINNHLTEYELEKQVYLTKLKQRAKLFIEQADKVGLQYYQYKEGFFVTVKFLDNAKRDLVHQKLMEKHIYTIKVNKGIRVGVCAASLDKIDGLAAKIKELI